MVGFLKNLGKAPLRRYLPVHALAGKHTLGRRDRALLARIERDRRAQGAGQTLERRFGDVMRILAIESLDVNGHRGMRGERLEKLADKFAVEGADLGVREFCPENQKRPAGKDRKSV